jgi:protein TonB
VKKRKSIVKKVTRKRKIRKKPLKKIVQKPIIEPVAEPISQPVFTQPQPTIKQSTIDTTTIKNRYQNRVRKKIKNSLIYPRIAKKLRLQGVVNVAFTILKNGQVTSIKIISSPKAILSKGAKKTLKNIIFDSIPDELNLDQMNLSIPIEFKLKG